MKSSRRYNTEPSGRFLPVFCLKYGGAVNMVTESKCKNYYEPTRLHDTQPNRQAVASTLSDKKISFSKNQSSAVNFIHVWTFQVQRSKGGGA